MFDWDRLGTVGYVEFTNHANRCTTLLLSPMGQEPRARGLAEG